jgi:hypothetical protein
MTSPALSQLARVSKTFIKIGGLIPVRVESQL